MKWVSCNNRAITIPPPSIPPFTDDTPAASCFGRRQLMNTYEKKVNTRGGWREAYFAKGPLRILQWGQGDLNQAFLLDQVSDEWLADSRHDEHLSCRWSNWFCKVSPTDGFQHFEIQNPDNEVFGKTLWRLKLVLVTLWKSFTPNSSLLSMTHQLLL